MQSASKRKVEVVEDDAGKGQEAEQQGGEGDDDDDNDDDEEDEEGTEVRRCLTHDDAGLGVDVCWWLLMS